MSGLFRFWHKDVEPVKTITFPRDITPPRVLPPVAFVRERLEMQQKANEDIILKLEADITRLSEELRQRKVVNETFKQAVDTLSHDPAAKQEIIPPVPKDPQLWSEILKAAGQRNDDEV